MNLVRYAALAVVTLVVSAAYLGVVYVPVIAWVMISANEQAGALFFFAILAGYLLLPGLIVFGLIAPVLVMKDIGRGWWHLVAPICFGAGSTFWVTLALVAPYVSGDPKAGVVYGGLFYYSLPAVLAGLLGGSLAAAGIEKLDWFGP